MAMVRTTDEKKKHVSTFLKEQTSYNITAKEYARKHNIPPSTLNDWLKAYGGVKLEKLEQVLQHMSNAVKEMGKDVSEAVNHKLSQDKKVFNKEAASPESKKVYDEVKKDVQPNKEVSNFKPSLNAERKLLEQYKAQASTISSLHDKIYVLSQELKECHSKAENTHIMLDSLNTVIDETDYAFSEFKSLIKKIKDIVRVWGK